MKTKVSLDSEKWEKYFFSDIALLVSEKFDPKQNKAEYICIELEHISSENGMLLGQTSTKETLSIKNRFRFNDVLFGKLRPYLKKYYLAKFQGVCSTEIWVLRSKDNLCISSYLYYIVQSSIFDKVANISAGTKMPRSDWNVVSNLVLKIPPLDEQKKIAEILGTIDRTLELTEKLITAKHKLKQALMQKLLTGKLRFPEFEGQKWITKKIGSFADVTAGGTPSTTEKSYWGGNIRWMNSGELNLKRVYEVIGRITEDGLKNSSTKLIPANSVLIGLAGQGKTRGTVAVNLVELCTNQSIAAILPNKQFSYWFLYHNLEYRYEELRSLSTGEGGRGGLNLGIIKRIETDFPSIDEQEKIASCLNNLDDEIGILEKQKQLLTKQKKGLMQKLLTGKIRVKTDN